MPVGQTRLLPTQTPSYDLIERDPDHYDSGDFSFHNVTTHYVTPDEAQALVLRHRRVLCGINFPMIAFIPTASACALTSIIFFANAVTPGQINLAAPGAVCLATAISLIGAAACYMRAYISKSRARIQPQPPSFDGV